MKKLVIPMLLATILLVGCKSNASEPKQEWEISEAQVKTSVLYSLNLNEDDCNYLNIKKDVEDGQNIYQVHIKDNVHEYKYIVDRQSGEILNSTLEKLEKDDDKDSDQNDGSKPNTSNKTEVKPSQNTTPSSSNNDDNQSHVTIVPQNDIVQEPTTQTNPVKDEIISKDDAIQLIVNKVPNVDVNRIEIELDKDDGKIIYEGEFYYKEKEYEFEINAKTGTFLEWSIENKD